jgi:hypothetical protein
MPVLLLLVFGLGSQNSSSEGVVFGLRLRGKRFHLILTIGSRDAVILAKPNFGIPQHGIETIDELCVMAYPLQRRTVCLPCLQ